MENHDFTLPPAAYTVDIEGDDGTKVCYIAVNALPDDQGLYILGGPFLRSFTTTFDYSDQSMELAINTNAPSGVKIAKKLSTWAIIGIVAACVVVVIVLAVVAYLCYKKRKRTMKGRSHVIGGSNNKKTLVSRQDDGTEITKNLIYCGRIRKDI